MPGNEYSTNETKGNANLEKFRRINKMES